MIVRKHTLTAKTVGKRVKNRKRKVRKKEKGSKSFLWVLLVVTAIFFTVKSYIPEYSRADGSLSLPDHQSYEIPNMKHNMGQIIKRKGYSLSYNSDYKTPYWVGWELTREETKGSASRTDKFLPDPEINGRKVVSSDYSHSGYDRGHMAPAGDMKWDKNIMAQSFYMTNICPQVPNLNRGDWNDLEEKSRYWACKYGRIYITCGPIYDNVTPKRIGKNRVAVPNAFYKVILINDKISPKAFGFIFENKSGNRPLLKYVVSVDSVEKRTGIDFFPALADKIENKIEAEIIAKFP